jgi:benzoyl-CoA reductase subunit B
MERRMNTAANQKPEAQKEKSMLLQKAMINANYEALATAHEDGKKISSTFVPGNLNELLMCFDLVRNLPEINALQAGMRKKSGGYVMEAERAGHSEDVCTYVKSDLGMMAKGQVGPNGMPLPTPDVLVLSYTGCFTFMKWFELVRDQYDCETVMLHVPYMSDGKITENMRKFVVMQLKEHVIPTLERVKPRKTSYGYYSRRKTGRHRSMPTSAAFITADRSLRHSVAARTRPNTTKPYARKSRSG